MSNKEINNKTNEPKIEQKQEEKAELKDQPMQEKPVVEAIKFPWGATITRHSDAFHLVNDTLVLQKGDYLVKKPNGDLAVMTEDAYKKLVD